MSNDHRRIIDNLNNLTRQNYSKIKSECLNQNKLFVDDLFLPNERSLFKTRNISGIVWKRPSEIVSDPKLVIGGAQARDVNQGQLGNCWFVAALSVLASEKKIWNKVILDYSDQEINDKNYAGIFKFRFWQFGKWIEIVVDDLLPTINDRLMFTHSSAKNEFWSSLLEKAYAKLNGCYEHLDGGNLSEALQDFTGGICETVQIDYSKEYYKPDRQEHLFEVLKKAYERNSLMACAINIKSRYEMEQKLSCGLVKGHAYGITKIKEMTIKGNTFLKFLSLNKEKLNMIRLKNPWGAHEWVGAWSDNSDEWKRVPKSEREKMGLNFDDDGEFWMEFSDFLRYFNELSICRNINTSLLTIRKTWSESLIYGKWISPDRAGGCVNFRDSFCNNPQYLFEIDNNSDKPDEVLINLDQLSQRIIGKENLTIGFFIMRVEDNRKYRLHKPMPKTASSSYINTRSVFLRYKLTNGRYVIVPSTFDPNIEGNFLLRIYCDDSCKLRELKKDCPVPFLHGCNPFSKYASCVTSILVKSGLDLVNPESDGNLDTYICIKCENKKVEGRVIKNSLNPDWNTSAIFYRYHQNKPIQIEVMIKKAFHDELYGSISLDAEPNNKHILIESNLTGTPQTRGKIQVEIQSMTNINAL